MCEHGKIKKLSFFTVEKRNYLGSIPMEWRRRRRVISFLPSVSFLTEWLKKWFLKQQSCG